MTIKSIKDLVRALENGKLSKIDCTSTGAYLFEFSKDVIVTDNFARKFLNTPKEGYDG